MATQDLNLRIIFEYLPLFIRGAGLTLWISFLSLGFAMIVGLIACLMRLSNRKVLYRISETYLEVFRCTPLLCQLYFLYFGLPSLGIHLTEIQIGIIALGLNSGAYFSEILRGGLSSVAYGQWEASLSSGLNRRQTLRYIILPQALHSVGPAILGQSIILVKDSSLLSLISVAELLRSAQFLASERFMPTEAYLTVGIIYLGIYYLIKYGINRIKSRRIRQWA